MIYTLDTQNTLSLSPYIYNIYIYIIYIYRSLEQTIDPEIDTQLCSQKVFDKVIEAFNEGRKVFSMHSVGPLDSHVQT